MMYEKEGEAIRTYLHFFGIMYLLKRAFLEQRAVFEFYH